MPGLTQVSAKDNYLSKDMSTVNLFALITQIIQVLAFHFDITSWELIVVIQTVMWKTEPKSMSSYSVEGFPCN